MELQRKLIKFRSLNFINQQIRVVLVIIIKQCIPQYDCQQDGQLVQ